MTEQPKSRLDREIEEILAKKAQEPINLNQRRKEKQRQERRTQWSELGRSIWQSITLNPLILALMSALIAMLIGDSSRLLALVFGTIAVGALWVPGLRRLMGFDNHQNEIHYWRGQAYAPPSVSSQHRSPLEILKNMFYRRR